MYAKNMTILNRMKEQLEAMIKGEEQHLDNLGEKESDSAQESYDTLQDQLEELESIKEAIEELLK